MIRRLYRGLRNRLLRTLREDDRAAMDEFVDQRLRSASSRPARAAVWWFEFIDLGRAASRTMLKRTSSFSWLDVKVGARLLMRQPGLSVVALATLMVGIPVGLGPIHAVRAMETPPDVPGADRLVILKNYDTAKQSWERSRLFDFVTWRRDLTTVEQIGAVAMETFNVVTGDGEPQPVAGAITTARLFDVFPTSPVLGRGLVSEDELEGADDVAVIGHATWQTRYGGDHAVLGESVRIAGRAHTIVGVMPESFQYPWRQDLWIPLRTNEATARPGSGQRVVVFGRLADGAEITEARAEAAALGQRVAEQEPDTHERLVPEVVPYTTGLFGLPRGGLTAELGFYLLQIMTIVILVVVCTNISMLMLARTASRAEEIAVRMALGARRQRVITQLFTESLLVAVGAAGAGLVVADLIVRRSQITTALELALPPWIDFGIGTTTMAMGLGLAGVSAAVVGIIPALKVTGGNVQQNIQQAAAGRAGIRFGGFSSALIVVDVAIAMLAVGVAAGAWDTQRAGGLGLDAERHMTVSFRIPGTLPGDDVAAFDPEELVARTAATERALAARLSAEPGFGPPAYATVLPGSDHPGRWMELEGDETLGADRPAHPRVRVARVSQDFFSALGHPILAGRDFDAADAEGATEAVIVNTRFVDRILEGESALGRRFRYQPRGTEEQGPWLEIIGVVGDLGMDTDNPTDGMGVYHLLEPGTASPTRFAIRVEGTTDDSATRLRALLAEIDATAVMSPPVPLSQVFNFDRNVVQWISLGIMAFIAAVLVLSAMSLYALMSFTVAQRTREIGIRIAMGAEWDGVARAVGRRALAQLAIGFALGAPAAVWFLSTMTLVETQRIVAAVAIDSVVLLLVGGIACLAPTLRALRINPTEALRNS